ncbi:alcohol dehydrogenase catalytic domain-containing protein [Plantactinospora sp. GCM10030261]|uniref:alcohol dehydrogenase catalytic domain-containing protein n=1 Tax=Plantactinospora sp. GCM10030261 TaxID=3273420 RepID=UPI00360BC55D
MKAVVITGLDGTWEVRDVPTPSPAPGQVLVRVRACGICHNDVLATRGVIPFPSVDPPVPGHEAVGEIVEVGAGVRTRAVGDRVGVPWIQGGCGSCDHCRRGLPLTGQTAFLCAAPATTGFTVPGGQSEYLVADAAGTVPLPAGVPDELAAPVLCAGYTAWSALRTAEPRPHDRIAVVGIGGVGHLAVQFAHATGAETVAVTHSPDKHAAARELGADLVVGTGAELAAAGGADVILMTGNSHRAAADTLPALRPGGRLVLAGIDLAEPFAIPPGPLPFFALGQRVLGATHAGPSYLAEALDLVARGLVTPRVEVFDADRVADAVRRVAKGEVRFRAVVSYPGRG